MAGGTGEAGEETQGEESMTEYERQRLARIRENKARMEALGLRGLSSSLQTNSESPTDKRKKKKRKRVEEEEEEEEYRPSDEEEEEEMEAEETSVSREEEREGSKKKKKGPPKSSGNGNDCDFVDEDTALAQAIALSLNESVKNSDLKETKVSQLGKINVIGKEESPRKRNMKKPNKSGIKLTEDEVIAFFFTLDEAGKGYITASDIEKMAIIHDFTWTDFEIAKMVHCFDSGGDRKLSLADFRSIVSQCNMSQET